MSISSDKMRIENGLAAIKTAIAAKGVSVPNGAKVDELAPLIDSIQTGSSVVTGTVNIGNDVVDHIVIPLANADSYSHLAMFNISGRLTVSQMEDAYAEDFGYQYAATTEDVSYAAFHIDGARYEYTGNYVKHTVISGMSEAGYTLIEFNTDDITVMYDEFNTLGFKPGEYYYVVW